MKNSKKGGVIDGISAHSTGPSTSRAGEAQSAKRNTVCPVPSSSSAAMPEAMLFGAGLQDELRADAELHGGRRAASGHRVYAPSPQPGPTVSGGARKQELGWSCVC
eukprot:scaffold2502_cov362-Prasinococcus_capsulatus_cf.AAC.2